MLIALTNSNLYFEISDNKYKLQSPYKWCLGYAKNRPDKIFASHNP